MYFAKKMRLFSVFGVSIVGSLFHSIGQILIAIVFLHNIYISYSLPLLLLFSIPTGLFTGLISQNLLKVQLKGKYL